MDVDALVLERPTPQLVQRLAALQQANATRVYRGELKREVRAGRSAREVLEERDPRTGTMLVWDVLFAVRGIGREKLKRAFRGAVVPQSMTVGRMTDVQRERLLALLRLR